MCYCPTLAALLSHFKYFFLFQRCCTICLCSRADEKGVMQAPKFEIFPGLILFQDRRDPFFAACLFVLLSHLCKLQSWKKSTSITAPPAPRQASCISSMPLICLLPLLTATGSTAPSCHQVGRMDPCGNFIMLQSGFQLKSSREWGRVPWVSVGLALAV